MQQRLTRSNTEVMLAGICGGLGEYFNLDPVIVRLIFVLVTLTSGLGIPVYILLWVLMPKRDTTTTHTYQQSLQQHMQQFGEEASRIGQHIGDEAKHLGQQLRQEAREVIIAQRRQPSQQQRVAHPGQFTQQPPDPSEYKFDPLTGQPIQPNQPAIGETVHLGWTAPDLPAQHTPPMITPQHRRRNWSVLGIVLVGIGCLILLEEIGIDMSLIFPLLFILAGFILLKRRR